MSVIPQSDDAIWLITAAVAQWHDRDVLLRNLPDGVTVQDRTTKYECFLVTGPKSREMLAPLTDADLTLPWLCYQEAQVCGKACVLLRVSFAGELGWEVHCLTEDAPEIYDAILGAGAKPFGMYALNALRIEKGYRAWKGDLSTDYTLLQGGLDRFVKLDKPQDFPGKAALQNEKQQGVTKRFVTLTVDAGGSDAPYMSTIWHDGQVVGETTSGDWGYRVNASIALGMLRAELAVPGTELEIDIYGEMRKAVVQKDEPLWDPQNERLRA
jgi:dimethylglycine dehydrogenase